MNLLPQIYHCAVRVRPVRCPVGLPLQKELHARYLGLDEPWMVTFFAFLAWPGGSTGRGPGVHEEFLRPPKPRHRLQRKTADPPIS